MPIFDGNNPIAFKRLPGRDLRCVAIQISWVFEMLYRVRDSSTTLPKYFPRVSEVIQTRRPQLFGHISYCGQCGAIPGPFEQWFPIPPRGWKRPGGHSRHAWTRKVEADLRCLNFSLHTTWRRYKDGSLHVVETATLRRIARHKWRWWWCW